MNISEAKQLLKAAESANDTVIFEGVHGIGKSDVVKQYAKESNYFCQELFLSMMDVGDLLGIPRTVLAGASMVTVWAEPVWFKRIKDAAWPEELELDALHFVDPVFRTFVDLKLSRS